MPKRRKHKESIGREKILLFGVLIAAVSLLLISALLTLISMKTENPTALTDATGLASFMISGAVSGFITAKIKEDGGLLIPTLSSLIFVLILVIIGLLASGGNLPPRCLVNYLCYMGISVLFSFFGSRQRKRRRH